MCRPPSSGRVRRRACGLPCPASRSAIASLRRAARLLFDRCATAPETRQLLAVSRAHPSRVQRRPTGGEAVIPRPVVRGPMAVVLPHTPRPFWVCHCWLCWSSAGGDEVPSSAGNGAGSGWWSPLPLRAPAGDPTPITHVKVCTRAKSTTSFPLSKQVPGFKSGYQFSGCRLTSQITNAKKLDWIYLRYHNIFVITWDSKITRLHHLKWILYYFSVSDSYFIILTQVYITMQNDILTSFFIQHILQGWLKL